MAIIVQKYGGTSVGSLSRIEAVAANIIKTRQQGHQVVVVLSAMSGETNRLLDMAYALDKHPSNRELDMLLATGEQTSIALLAIALIQRGYSAVSLLAHQIGILTDNHFGRARIKSIDNKRLLQSLEQEQIVIVAGFQGVDIEKNITTLGRGGSDTSAVAIAATLGASECQIFTDVDGIYTADPRVVPTAKKLDCISFDEMLVMASLGAKVLHNRSVEYAMQHNLPIRVLSSFSAGNGTQVVNQNNEEWLMKRQNISSVVHQQQEVMININKITSNIEIAAIFSTLAKENIEVDMINQSFYSAQDEDVAQLICLNFTIHKRDQHKVIILLEKVTQTYPLLEINVVENIAKLSVIGVGVTSQVGLVFSTLAQKNITISLISSSEIQISVIINEIDLIEGLTALHNAFNLTLLT